PHYLWHGTRARYLVYTARPDRCGRTSTQADRAPCRAKYSFRRGGAQWLSPCLLSTASLAGSVDWWLSMQRPSRLRKGASPHSSVPTAPARRRSFRSSPALSKRTRELSIMAARTLRVNRLIVLRGAALHAPSRSFSLLSAYRCARTF